MLFNTWLFVAFFIVVYLVYLRLRHRAQNWLLLVASYVFYASWDYRFLSLIVLSTVVDYLCGLGIAGTESTRRRRALVTVSMVSNLGLLGAFKYYDFFAESLAVLLEQFGMQASMSTLGVVLPVGISFYTFQTMSYTIDLYRREVQVCRSFPDFALFVAFFPQLVAGPIERAKHLIDQVRLPRRITTEGLREGIWWILLGYFMKVFVADNLATIADPVFASDATRGARGLLAVLAFAFQIYGDFAGYTHIARGVARLMGFDIIKNFDVPYVATSPSDFWRRWHISLSTWLRDYLYIPLGGNRGSGLATYRNLMITMLLGGLWHGAEWKFVIWGAYHGLLLCLFRAFGLGRAKLPGQRGWTPLRVVQALLFFCLTLYGWLIFRCDRISQIWEWPLWIVQRFKWRPVDTVNLEILAFLIVPVVLIDLLTERARTVNFILQWRAPVRWLVYALMIALIFVFGKRGGEQFIYFQF